MESIESRRRRGGRTIGISAALGGVNVGCWSDTARNRYNGVRNWSRSQGPISRRVQQNSGNTPEENGAAALESNSVEGLFIVGACPPHEELWVFCGVCAKTPSPALIQPMNSKCGSSFPFFLVSQCFFYTLPPCCALRETL